jgi:DNA repair exonuclease SbcCD ATPase subunit
MSHEDSVLDLDGSGSAVLTGPVGAGKTAFVEALTWALWDRTRAPTLDSLIRDGAGECRVVVDLDVGGRAVRVTRARARGRDSVIGLEVDGEQQTRHTSGETRAALVDLIGLDYEAALAGPLMVQKGRAFMDAQPRERKDLLARLFGLDRWAEWEERARGRRDGALAAARLAEQQIDGVPRTLDQDIEVVASAIADEEARLDALRERLAEAEAHLRSREAELAELRARAGRAEEVGARLEEARRKFIEQKDGRYIDAVNRAHATAEARVALHDREPEVIPDAALADADRVAGEAQEFYEAAAAQLAATQAVAQVRAEQVQCPHCGRAYALADAIGEYDEGGAQRTVQHAVDLRQRALQGLADIRATRSAREQWERRLREAVREDEAAMEAMRAETRHTEELAQQGRALRAEHEALRGDAEALLLVEQGTEAARGQAAHLRSEVEAALRAAGDHRAAAARLSALAEQRETAARALADTREEYQVYAVVSRLMGRDGVPAMILDGLVPEVERRANEVLARMPGGLRVSLRTQRATARGEAREALDAVIETEAGERPYEMLSGGQQFRVDLALRLALTGLLATRDVDMLVVDEGLDRHQDDEGRRAVLDALAEMRTEFGLVLAISHHPEVVEFFDRQVEVQMEGGVSRLREAA